MKALLTAICASFVLAGPSIGAVPQVRSMHTDPAHKLAKYLNSGDRVEELLLPLLSIMPQIMANSPEWKRLVERKPDGAPELMRAIRPVILQSISNKLPQLWNRIAVVYEANLTPDESGALLAAYSTPASVKLNRAMMQRLDLSQLLNAQGQFDHRKAAQMTAQIYPAALSTLTLAESAEVLAFRSAPLATKFAGLRTQVASARGAWIEECAPSIEMAVVKALPALSASAH